MFHNDSPTAPSSATTRTVRLPMIVRAHRRAVPNR
jgi:hypothetical protein